MKIWLKFVIGITIFAILLNFVDWRKSGALLLDTTLIPVLLSSLTLVFCILLSSFKWNILLRAQNLFLSSYALLRFYWIGTFFNNCFPSTVGGDVVRLSFMRHLGHLPEVTASIVLERITGLVVLLGLSALGLLIRPQYYETGSLLSILWLIIGIISVGLVLVAIFCQYITDRPTKRSQSEVKFLRRIIAKFRKVVISIVYYKKKKESVIYALIISLPFYGSTVLFQYLLFYSLGLHVPMREIFFIAPLILLVSLLPISFNALGLAEGAFVLFYTQAGLSPEEALAAALLRRILNILISLVGGIFWISSKSNQTNTVRTRVPGGVGEP